MAKLTRIKNFYKLAQIEYNKYKNSKDKDLEGADHLAEAGEKLWNVYNMLCEYITKQKIRNEKQLRNELTKYSNLLTLKNHNLFFFLFQFLPYYHLYIYFFASFNKYSLSLPTCFLATIFNTFEI